MLFLFQQFYKQIQNEFSVPSDCILFCSTLYPSQCLTSLSLLLSLYHLPSSFYASSICFYYPSSRIEWVLHSFFLLSSSTDPLVRADIQQAIHWETQWIQTLRQQFSFHQVLDLLVKEINTFTEQHSEIFILQDETVGDPWTDAIDNSWNGLFVSLPRERLSKDTSFSFTLSGKSSLPTSTSVLLQFVPDLIQFLSELLFHRLDSIQSEYMEMIQYVQHQKGSLTSFTGYTLLLTLLCKMAKGIPYSSVPALFAVPSELAPLNTFPSYLLLPFLTPGLTHFLQNEDSDTWNHLEIEQKVCMVRCFPLFLKAQDRFTRHEIENSSFLWNAYCMVQYWFLNQEYAPSATSDPPFLLNLFLTSFASYQSRIFTSDLKTCMISRVSKYIGFEVLQYSLHHLYQMDEGSYQQWYEMSMMLVNDTIFLLDQIMDEDHSCISAPALILIMTSLEKQQLISVLSNQQRVDRFVEYVLCYYRHCSRKQKICRCVCPNEHDTPETEMAVLREAYAVRQEKVVDCLRCLFPRKSIQQHPLYSILHTLFPTVSTVY